MPLSAASPAPRRQPSWSSPGRSELAEYGGRDLGFRQSGFGDRIMVVVDAFGLAYEVLFGQLESFRFTAAGLGDRAFGFTPFSFPVVLLDHGRKDSHEASGRD